MTVFPAPKGPGIAAAPPFASGKSASSILCPVISGISGTSFFFDDRGIRIGHVCASLRTALLSSFATVSSTVYFPLEISVIFPLIPGGTRMRCVIPGHSSTVPMMSPWETKSPFFFVALKSHFFFSSSPDASTPRRIKSPICFTSVGRGRWIPSYIDVKSPGPSFTERGMPVVSTGSPGLRPVVFS